MSWWSLIPIAGKAIDSWQRGRAEKESNRHSETLAVHQQFGAEFRNLTHRTKWDSFIDGLNRLPRPVMVTMILAYMVAAWRDPETFALINAGLATIPEPMWYLIGAIVGFYFAARELHKQRVSPKSFEQSAKVAKEIARIKKPTTPSIGPVKRSPPAELYPGESLGEQ